MSSNLKILVNLFGVKQCLLVILTRISLTTDKMEHLFMSLLAIHVSSSVKCLCHYLFLPIYYFISKVNQLSVIHFVSVCSLFVT